MPLPPGNCGTSLGDPLSEVREVMERVKGGLDLSPPHRVWSSIPSQEKGKEYLLFGSEN